MIIFSLSIIIKSSGYIILGHKNVTSLNGLFFNCQNLTEIPNISNWDIENITDLGGFFENCLNLRTLPDISKWNTVKVEDMTYMFYKLLKSLSNISKKDSRKLWKCFICLDIALHWKIFWIYQN